MARTIEIADEAMIGLEKLARENNLSIPAVITGLISFYNYKIESQVAEYEELSELELSVIRASIEKANLPGAKRFSLEEVIAELETIDDEDEDDEEVDWVLEEDFWEMERDSGHRLS